MCTHDGMNEECSERCTCPCDNCVPYYLYYLPDDTPAEKLLKEIFSARPELD